MKPDPITAVRPCKSSGCPGKVYSDKNHGLCKKCREVVTVHWAYVLKTEKFEKSGCLAV
jgi:hypothetical protein